MGLPASIVRWSSYASRGFPYRRSRTVRCREGATGDTEGGAGEPLARLLPVEMIVATVGMMALYFTSGAGSCQSNVHVLPGHDADVVCRHAGLRCPRHQPHRGDQREPARLPPVHRHSGCRDHRRPRTSTCHCNGAIPSRKHCGPWSAACGCGSATPRIPTSAISGSESATNSCAPHWSRRTRASQWWTRHFDGAAQLITSARWSRPCRSPWRCVDSRLSPLTATPRPRGRYCAPWSVNWRSCTALSTSRSLR